MRHGSTPAGIGRAILAIAALAAGCAREEYTQISDTPAGAYEASLAPIAGGFVAAWYDTRDGHGEIYMRRLDASGTPIAPERRLTVGDVDAYEADVTAVRLRQGSGRQAHSRQGSGGQASDAVVVGWYEKTAPSHLTPKIGAFAVDGTARWVKTLSSHGRNTVVRAAGGLVFAAWIQDEDKDHSSVWGTWRRADGVDLIPPRRLAAAGPTTWNLNAAIDPDATPGRPRAWIVFDAKAGTRAEELFLVETGESTDHIVQLTADDGAASKYPDLALSDERAAVAWFDMKDGNEEVYLAVRPRTALADGPLSAATRITSTQGHSIGAYLTWNGDRLGLAWCDDTPGNQELYFATFDGNGHQTGATQRMTTTSLQSSIPAIKPSDNGFALLWNEHQPASHNGHGGGRSQVVFRFVR